MTIMMKFRDFPHSMRHRVRSFVMSSKTARRNQRYREILCSLSPGLRGEVALQVNRLWIEKVSFFAPFLHGLVPEAIVETCLAMEFEVYAQSETFGRTQVLYIVKRGLCSHRGRLWRHGAVWGVDFVLSDPTLIKTCKAFALTYIELATVSRHSFLDVLQKNRKTCPELVQHVRRFTIWLAFQRALLKEARRR